MSGRSLDDITGEIIDAGLKLHRALGPGLFETVYEVVLARDLERRGLHVARQQAVSFEYDGIDFPNTFRVNLMVERRVVVEIKSVERLVPIHSKQLLTYLRLLQLPLGLMINFGCVLFKDGVQRVANGLEPSASPRLRVNQSGAGT